MSEYIVFYGTLKKGHETRMHGIMDRALEHIGECVIPGVLYRKERYPALKFGEGRVYGELYEVQDNSVLIELDEYEAADNQDSSLPGFTRKRVNLIKPELQAWVYYYDGSVKEGERIGRGSWD